MQLVLKGLQHTTRAFMPMQMRVTHSFVLLEGDGASVEEHDGGLTLQEDKKEKKGTESEQTSQPEPIKGGQDDACISHA